MMHTCVSYMYLVCVLFVEFLLIIYTMYTIILVIDLPVSLAWLLGS